MYKDVHCNINKRKTLEQLLGETANYGTLIPGESKQQKE